MVWARVRRFHRGMRSLVAALALAALAELALLGVFVFLDEPGDRFHAADVAYFAVPFVLAAAAGSLLARSITRALRGRPRQDV
jgi:hypothetical protein